MDQQIIALKNLFGELFAKIMAFAMEEEFEEDLCDSLIVFYNLEEGEEYEFIPTEEFLFLSWYLLDDVDTENESLIDEFQRCNADELTLQETQICQALKDTNLSLMQVLDVTPEESITLRDVFLGEEFKVWESVGSDGIVKGNLLYSRVLTLGDSRFLVGAGVFLDPVVLPPLTQFITNEYHRECEEGKPVSFKQFLKENGELINWWIRAFEKGTPLEDDPNADPKKPTPDPKDPKPDPQDSAS